MSPEELEENNEYRRVQRRKKLMIENKFLGINTLNYIRNLNIKVLDQGIKWCRKMVSFSKMMR